MFPTKANRNQEAAAVSSLEAAAVVVNGPVVAVAAAVRNPVVAVVSSLAAGVVVADRGRVAVAVEVRSRAVAAAGRNLDENPQESRA